MKTICIAPILLIFAGALLAAQSNPVPLVYQPLSPASVKPGHTGFVLGVRGTGFVQGATVRWNGKPLKTRFLSGGALQAEVPSSNVSRPGTGSVTVANPGSIASNVVYLR